MGRALPVLKCMASLIPHIKHKACVMGRFIARGKLPIHSLKCSNVYYQFNLFFPLYLLAFIPHFNLILATSTLFYNENPYTLTQSCVTPLA